MVEKYGEFRYTTDFSQVHDKVKSLTKSYAGSAVKKEDFVSAVWLENAKGKGTDFVLITNEVIFDNSNGKCEHMNTQNILKIEDVLQFKVLTKAGKNFIFFNLNSIPVDLKPLLVADIKKVQGKLR